MRVLVEQTEAVVRDALARVDLLWHGEEPHTGKVGVHLLMGGADPRGDWHLYPEDCAVLVGTQDMLLSRALNRGYGLGRARWPLEFGLLNHDALWVMDEVQLMDVGLATSAQLQAIHEIEQQQDHRPRVSWWMSATLQPSWLESVDTRTHLERWRQSACEVEPPEMASGVPAIRKSLECVEVPAEDTERFADLCLERHGRAELKEEPRITLVVCNTVDRACATYDAIRKRAQNQEVRLVHGRFRPAERATWREEFLQRAACSTGADRIIVATQVVEAGVDISASALVTELAPWPSLVQRFGRCARYAGAGHVVVVDRGRNDRTARPYSLAELESAWSALASLGEVGIAALESFEAALDGARRAELYPYAPRHLLLDRDLAELFDTTADLSGADIDVSRFIRESDDRDLLVFWDPVPRQPRGRPDPTRLPARDELCAVPFLDARNWLCGAESKSDRRPRLRSSIRAWVWDWLEGEWQIATRSSLLPGRTVCVASACGGYTRERGFDPGSLEPVPAVETRAGDLAAERADASEGADELSFSPHWKTLACHASEAADFAASVADGVGLDQKLKRVLVLAARWHDLGKVHPAFQGAMVGKDRPPRKDLAKAPSSAWLRPPGTYRDGQDVRRGLRHELASMLALFAVLRRCRPDHPALLGPWGETLDLVDAAVAPLEIRDPTPLEEEVLACTADEFDLLAYLVLCHHGKVRMALHASPHDQTYRDTDGRGLPIRGVREGDCLPSVVLDVSRPALPELRLTLDPAALGLSSVTGASWSDRAGRLLRRHGLARLAWLEALLIAADRRASRLATADPELEIEIEAGA